MTFYRFMFIFILATLPIIDANAEENIIIAHYRAQPPEITIDDKNGHFSGPLIDILNEAAQKIGYKIKWYKDDFKNSYECLKKGCVDIVPRVILNKERKAFVHYLGPIGFQQKNIYFLTRKGKEDRIRSYEDLYPLKIGIKKHVVYFKRFNKDNKLNKIPLTDDINMSKMFMSKRLDTVAVLDVMSIKKTFAELQYDNYNFAEYFFKQRIGNFYGMSKKSPKAHQLKALNNALNNMVESGRIRDIYKKYGIKELIH
jgi:polar amino acid transport system substrate-binding protein